MPKNGQRTVAKAKDCPTGNALVLLRDIPRQDRLTAYSYLVRGGHVDPDEAERLLVLVLDPGDAGGRIAA